MRTFRAFLFPGGILLLATVFLLAWGRAEARLTPFAEPYRYVALVAGLGLGLRLRRGRAVLALLVLAIGGWALDRFGAGGGVRPEVRRGVLAFVSILVPANFALISFLRDGRLSGWRGLGRIVLVLAQPVAVALALSRGRLPGVVAWLDRPIVDAHFLGVAPLPQVALLAFAVGISLLLVRFLERHGAIESGLFWGLAATLASLLTRGEGLASTVYLGTASLVLALSIVESSHALAFRDELTGLRSRRALDEACDVLGRRYAIAMIDIDHFKKLNDTYGHEVGDQALRWVASKLGRVAGGRAYRYGGEEFTVLFPGRGVDEAKEEVERFRESIELSPFVARGGDRPRKRPRKPDGSGKAGKPAKKVPITVSAGVAERDSQCPTPAQVLDAADEALYRAKRGGRNRVC